eukprot:6168824-Pleurochrysis_carterae.AAC.1
MCPKKQGSERPRSPGERRCNTLRRSQTDGRRSQSLGEAERCTRTKEREGEKIGEAAFANEKVGEKGGGRRTGE